MQNRIERKQQQYIQKSHSIDHLFIRFVHVTAPDFNLFLQLLIELFCFELLCSIQLNNVFFVALAINAMRKKTNLIC